MPKFPTAGAAVLASALLLGAAPFLATSSAAGCPAWTDVAGDSTTDGAPDPSGQMYDPNLDIVKASLLTSADSVTAVIGVKTLNANASDAGDEHHVLLTVAGKDLELYADRGASSNGVKSPLGFTAGVFNNTDGTDTAVAAAPVYDTKAGTVTVTAKLSELKTAAGVEVAGKAITGLGAETYDSVDALPLFQYDDATAPAGTTATVGTPCGGGDPVPVPTPTPTPTPGGPAPDGFPATGCNTVPDVAGDAHPANEAAAPAEQDLDLTGLAMLATGTDVKAFVRIAKLATRPSTTPGHAFYVNFTVGGKAVQLITHAFDPAQLALPQDTVSDTTKTAPVKFAPSTYLSVAGSYVPTGLKATYDTAHSTLILAMPRADMTKALPAFADGAQLTALTVRSANSYPELVDLYADSTAAANAAAGTATWTVGDNACFGPPPAKLAVVGKTTVQYTDAAALAAKLTDAAGKPLAGRAMKFAIGSVTATATTGPDGIAKAALNPNVTAGAYSLVTSFAGDSAAAKADLTAPFTVTPETTRLVLSVTKNGSKRVVTAKLLDDDGHAVSGQTVSWYVNGKKVSSAKTNAAGAVTFATAKPTQTVMAEFLAVAGKFNGAKASQKV
jgi:hypothetical protein